MMRIRVMFFLFGRRSEMTRPTYEAEGALIGANVTVQDSSLMDFWKWAFSDLCDDDIKGVFVEWMVLKLLGIPSERRISWANSDIITQDGVRIEVKASSYWQSWKLLDEFGKARVPYLCSSPSKKTKIKFAGLRARDAVTISDPSLRAAFKSDLYIFALQHERVPERWNAMDLSQWEFYVLPAKKLEDLGCGSVSLERLQSEQRPMDASNFVAKARQLIEEVAREKRSEARLL
jgi:hypothetical protein